VSQRDLGTRPKLGDHLTGAQRSHVATALEGFAAAVGPEKTAGVEIAGTRRVEERAEAIGGNGAERIGRHHKRSLFAPRESSDAAATAGMIECLIKPPALVQGGDLSFIGEEQIHVAIHELQEALAVTLHAEGI